MSRWSDYLTVLLTLVFFGGPTLAKDFDVSKPTDRAYLFWTKCNLDYVRKNSSSKELAETLARASLATCSELEDRWISSIKAQVESTGIRFDDTLRTDLESSRQGARVKMTDMLLAEVIDSRRKARK